MPAPKDNTAKCGGQARSRSLCRREFPRICDTLGGGVTSRLPSASSYRLPSSGVWKRSSIVHPRVWLGREAVMVMLRSCARGPTIFRLSTGQCSSHERPRDRHDALHPPPELGRVAGLRPAQLEKRADQRELHLPRPPAGRLDAVVFEPPAEVLRRRLLGL